MQSTRDDAAAIGGESIIGSGVEDEAIPGTPFDGIAASAGKATGYTACDFGPLAE